MFLPGKQELLYDSDNRRCITKACAESSSPWLKMKSLLSILKIYLLNNQLIFLSVTLRNTVLFFWNSGHMDRDRLLILEFFLNVR